MRRRSWVVVFLFASAIILGACSNDEDADSKEPAETNETETDTEEKEAPKDDKAVEEEDEKETGDLDEYGSPGESDREDQLYLGVGDSGTLETKSGDFEITLHHAELVGPEFEEKEAELETYVLLELTVKNIGDESKEVQEFMDTMEVREALDFSGEPNSAFMFDGLKEIEGILAPGEEISGDFFADTYDSDTYYLLRRDGNVTLGKSNQVIWTIDEEDLE